MMEGILSIALRKLRAAANGSAIALSLIHIFFKFAV